MGKQLFRFIPYYIADASSFYTIFVCSCGWAMIPLFAQPFPSDIEDGFEVAPEMVTSFFAFKLYHSQL
jgi:hypothetical protein